MTEELIRYDHITIAYGDREVVKDLSFSVKPGEILGIIGESGSGKSTILRAAMGLLGSGGRIARGDILFEGESLKNLSPDKQRTINGAKIGMVFQNAGVHFCPVRKLFPQLYESVRAHRAVTRSEFTAEAEKMLRRLGFTDPRRVLSGYPFELSGGMQQRLGLASAMLPGPSLLLADEPTSALDVTVQRRVMEEMLSLRETFGATMILVTHQLGVAERMADRILVMKNGLCLEQGETAQVLSSPSHDYTKQLLALAPRLRRDENA